MRALLVLFCVSLAVATASAQTVTPGDREKSRVQNRLGWDLMKSESFEQAAKAFQSSIDLDPEFEMPWYGLGRAHMSLKQFVLAISAFTHCRDLYVAEAGKQFTSSQDAQRHRQDRLTEIDEMIRQLNSAPQTAQTQEQLRQITEQRRQIQEAITHGNEVTMGTNVPPWVSLSLGSAYFRAGKIVDAEREYKATISVDPKSGEALNNLAVVYLETNRIEEAAASLKAAKKAGFKVNPNLEQEIQDRQRKKP